MGADSTMTECPRDCRERHVYSWRAICLALSGVGVLFALLGGLYLYLDMSYARAATVEGIEYELRDVRKEIREELREIHRKIDQMLQAENSRRR